MKREKKWLFGIIVFFLFLRVCEANMQINRLEEVIQKLHKNDTSLDTLKDSLIKSIKGKIHIDIYSGMHTLYIEWDENGYSIDHVEIVRQNKPLKKIINRKAKDIGHRWNGFADRDLLSGTSYRYKIIFYLKNGQQISESFSALTQKGSSFVSQVSHQFKIYDDIEGGAGDKEVYLRRHTKDGTMRQYGLTNSAMYWVDDFYEPVPSLDDSKSRVLSRPNIKKLQMLVLHDLKSAAACRKIDTKEGIVVLDIEHVPSVLEYVIREYSPYGAFVSKFLNTEKVRNHGKKIVREAMAKKLEAILGVKRLLPHTKVGLWNSVVLWNRYNDNRKNLDNTALAKGSSTHWRIDYDEWHLNDSLIYKPLIDVVDYVMPLAYPMFDLSTKEGRRKQEGYMLSKFMEIKRLNPDVSVIASISPHYTEGWAYSAKLAHKPLDGEDFKWYLETLYGYYKDGLIDSIHIWADNDNTRFSDFVRQSWWRELLKFNTAIR
jgi:hypothetical protein